MRCGRVKKLLWDYLDGRLGDDEKGRIEAHCSGCPACSAELAEMERTLKLLAPDETSRPSEEYWARFWPRLQRTIGEDGPVPPERRPGIAELLTFRRPLVALAGSAAIVLTALIVFNTTLFRGGGPVSGHRPGESMKAAAAKGGILEGGDFIVGADCSGESGAPEYVLGPSPSRESPDGRARPRIQYVLAQASRPGPESRFPVIY